MGSEGLNKKWKESVLTALAMVIKKDSPNGSKKAHKWIESQPKNCEDSN